MRLVYASLHRHGQGEGGTAHMEGLASGLRDEGAEVCRLVGDSDGPLRRWLAVTIRTVREARRSDPDFVLVRVHPAAMVLVLALRALRTSVVAELNGPFDDIVEAHPRWMRLRTVFDLMERRVLRSSSLVVAVTQSLADYARARANTPILVLPNAADPTRYFPGSGHREGEGAYVAFCGALAPWQGLDVLLAATRSPHWPVGVELHIAGDGPLRSMVERAGAGQVHYLGRLEPEQAAREVRGALAVVSPNTRVRGHGSPIKVYEAMMSCVPVVASDTAGQEIVEDLGVGLTYPAADPSRLAQQVQRLAAEPGLRESLAARACENRLEHSWQRRAQLLLGELASL